MKRELKGEPVTSSESVEDIIAEARKHLRAADNALAALQLHERAKQAQTELARLDEQKKQSGGDSS
jgi:uncharacterized membrane protein